MSNGNLIGGATNNYNAPVTYNFNFNLDGARQSAGSSQVLNKILDLLDFGNQSYYRDKFSNLFNGNTNTSRPTFPAPVETPSLYESGQPEGSLTVEGDKIKTAGGYEIEQLGQFEWKITGPDGKTTRIWGDPHVDEGDKDGATDWDFKRNSTFVLGDGTRINVTTAPYGNDGMTVTSGLEVISGNDRVLVSDIDKGKGNIGTVTQDGYAHANSFQGDVFVQGRETDDWSFQGKEIIGSNNGGESFQLGGELEPPTNGGVNRPNPNEDPFDQIMQDWFKGDFGKNLLSFALGFMLSNAFEPNSLGQNQFSNNQRPLWEGGSFDRDVNRSNAAQSFRDLANAFNLLANYSEMNDMVSQLRNRAYSFV